MISTHDRLTDIFALTWHLPDDLASLTGKSHDSNFEFRIQNLLSRQSLKGVATTKGQVKVFVDGPYGPSSDLSSYNTSVSVAGELCVIS
jgi:hypothetical protein